jgi:hypothetical protein
MVKVYFNKLHNLFLSNMQPAQGSMCVITTKLHMSKNSEDS